MKNSVNPDELKALLEKNPEAAIVIDVRRRNDFEADRHLIPGAQWKDPEQVESWGKDLPQDKPVVVYCVRGGSVSQSVALKLAESDLQVKYLEGGLAAWNQSPAPPAIIAR
jgi:rhodanese-related sulfurtransferase